ncbi:hypothetical protein [Limimaricola soesokkakensis]|uniref:hypothetical protein n=1 Tax=Limimaricola soesokkakensis TaxID=1343159 RepID=UPI001055F647|nr:hypothetical protein [Limimaricola soesokkakensis]
MRDSVARIESLDAVVERMLDDADLDWFYERLEHFKVPHLARPDIARLAHAAQGQPGRGMWCRSCRWRSNRVACQGVRLLN